MKNPLDISPSKGNQGTTRGKEKIIFNSVGIKSHNLRIRSTITLPTELRGRTEKVGEDCSSVGRVTVYLIRRSWVRFPPRSKEFFLLTSCGSLIPFTRANAQWVFHGLHIALKFTLQS